MATRPSMIHIIGHLTLQGVRVTEPTVYYIAPNANLIFIDSNISSSVIFQMSRSSVVQGINTAVAPTASMVPIYYD